MSGIEATSPASEIKRIVRFLLSFSVNDSGVITEHELEAALQEAKLFAEKRGLDPALVDDMRDMLKERFLVQWKASSILHDEDFRPWLGEASSTIDPFYWARYGVYLGEAKGWPEHIVTRLSDESFQVLNLCGNPAEEADWDRRGLVMGNVQSGKTANYIGLICKAADAGYKCVIVIAGTTTDLRNQTQTRIDEGFVGYDSSRFSDTSVDPIPYVGVGLIDSARRPTSLTNQHSDFNKNRARLGTPLENSQEPVVFVVKKNASVLKNLLDWLTNNGLNQGATRINQPLLLIDDEADNASVNTRFRKDGDPDYDVTAINRRLREILRLFRRSSYVGYTATPFANIFIDPDTDAEMLRDDLFPRSFIVSLDSPSNYMDGRRIFIDDSDEIVREISDTQPSLPAQHTKDLRVTALPRSLKEAVRAFLVTVAIKQLRGLGDEHSSMLINVSRFIGVQDQVWNLVTQYVDQIKNSFRVYGALPADQALGDPTINDVHDTWDREYHALGPWGEIQSALQSTAGSVEVVERNGPSKHALAYENYLNGRKVIVVGGQAISRGLTLEGLTISYYLRRTAMYDTLMQMGRWFGYRSGYEDLCRVYMLRETAEHYGHVTEAVEELRDELRYMQQVGATPREFGLKVRSHPDNVLIVTAKNKMGSAEKRIIRVSFSMEFIETSTLVRDEAARSQNLALAKALAASLESSGASLSRPGGSSHLLLTEVPVGFVLNFLRHWKNAQTSYRTEPSVVCDYVTQRAEDELSLWDVLFVGKREDARSLSVRVGGEELFCRRRNVADTSSDRYLKFHNARVGEPLDESFGLPSEEAAEIRDAYRAANPTRKTVPGNAYRGRRKRPLLVVHFLDLDAVPGAPVVAWGASFPRTSRDTDVAEYVINAVMRKELDAYVETEFEVDGSDEGEK